MILLTLLINPTHFDNHTGNNFYSISIIDSDPIHIDRELSNDDGTYVTIGCGFSNNKKYKRKIWDYKRADYLFVQQNIFETDRVNIVTGTSDIHGVVTAFTSIFLKIASTCIPTREVIIRNDDKVWFDSTLRREIRIRDRFRKTVLKVKSVLTETKYKQQRNKVNN